jgi:hypothetical protein
MTDVPLTAGQFVHFPPPRFAQPPWMVVPAESWTTSVYVPGAR